jgi:mannose-1-phosphate guanylyltransferase
MYYALIMAGGSGTRLWPLSRSQRPKQSLQLIGDRTMFQHAVDRIEPLFSTERIYVVTREEHADLLSSQVAEIARNHFILEPEGRGTAPAIGLGALYLRRRDPTAVMAVLTADHFITDGPRFCQVLAAAVQIANRGHLVTLGIRPSSPATGFGYIQQGEDMGSAGGFSYFGVERFTEKPEADVARQMVESGVFSWNSGMFIWRVDRILEEFQRQMPEFYTHLMQLDAVLGTPEENTMLKRIWPQVARQTIDYGVMEGAKDVVVIPVDIGWTDIGSWASLLELLPADENGNIFIGPTLGIYTHDTRVFGGQRLIAAIGVKDMVIVDTGDALLVCPKDRAQDVREVVEKLGKEGLSKWL